MDMSARSSSLMERHAQLDREISAEMQRPMPDSTRIAGLKRQKLRLKDELYHTSGSESYSATARA